MEVSDADRGIDPASRDGCHHSAGEVALLQDPDPGSRRGHVGDQLPVARPLEDGHGQILDAYVPSEGDPAQVVRDRVVEVDRTAGTRTGDELLHLRGRRQAGKTARVHRDEQRDGVDVTARHLARALHRVDTEVDLAVAGADDGAGWKGWIVARAQNDGACHVRAVECTAHRFAGRVADALRVALTKQTGTCERRGFGRLHELERELAARLIGRYPAPLLFHRVYELSDSSSSSAGRSSIWSPLCRNAALTKSRNNGCGRFGRERNSGWNWLATNHGWSSSSMISTRRPFGDTPLKIIPFSFITSRYSLLNSNR